MCDGTNAKVAAASPSTVISGGAAPSHASIIAFDAAAALHTATGEQCAMMMNGGEDNEVAERNTRRKRKKSKSGKKGKHKLRRRVRTQLTQLARRSQRRWSKNVQATS